MPWYWVWMLVVGAVIACGGSAASRLAGGGKACPAARPGARLARPPAVAVALGVLLPGIAFVLCTPSRFPFAGGLGMGFGVLLGFGAAVLALLVLWLASPGSGSQASLAGAYAALGGLAIVWVAVAQLLFRADPSYALLGGLAGILLSLLPALWVAGRDEVSGKALEVFALSALLLGLASLVAGEHYTTAPLRPYWALPTLAFAGGLLGVVIGGLMSGRARAAGWVSALCAVVIGLALWLAARVLFHQQHLLEIEPRLTSLLPLGWVAFGLAEGAAASASDYGGRPPHAARGMAVKFSLPLLGVVLVIVGFNLGGAYAVALALAAGLPLGVALSGVSGRLTADTGGRRAEAGPRARPRAARRGMRWTLTFGLLFLAYRLFLARFSDEVRSGDLLEFGRHYVLVGVMAAALWAMVVREVPTGRAAALLHWAALAIVPPLLFVVFGYEALLGLLLGFLLVQVVQLSLDGVKLKPVLFPLAAVWALIVPGWAHFLTMLPRGTRAVIIGAAATVLILGLSLLRAPDQSAGAGSAAEG